MTKSFPHHHEAEIPPHIKGLIFDCDGTLIDTMPIHYRAWCKTLADFGMDFPEAKFYSFAGMPTRLIVETLAREQGKCLDPDRVAELKERVYLKMMPRAPVIEAVAAIAKREKGHRKLAVASGGWHNIVVESLTNAGIVGLFDAIVGADDVVHGKPAPDMFLKAAELMGLPPAACLIYEDGTATDQKPTLLFSGGKLAEKRCSRPKGHDGMATMLVLRVFDRPPATHGCPATSMSRMRKWALRSRARNSGK